MRPASSSAGHITDGSASAKPNRNGRHSAVKTSAHLQCPTSQNVDSFSDFDWVIIGL